MKKYTVKENYLNLASSLFKNCEDFCLISKFSQVVFLPRILATNQA